MSLINRLLIVLFAAILGFSPATPLAPSVAAAGRGELLVYFGTYTGENSTSKGVYVARLDLASGKVTTPELAAETTNPSFLAIHPSGRFLYAANEVGTFNGEQTGSVSGFAINRTTGALTPLNQESSKGRGPAHLTVDKSGRVLVAIGPDGRMKPATAFVQHEGKGATPRQNRPHAHSINVSPNNRFAYAADLGLDKVLIYRFDAKAGTLAPADPPFATVQPGSGPRHFAFHPKGRFAFVINEISVTLTAFRADSRRGALTEVQTISTLPEGQSVQTGYSTAEVQVHPSGRFVYGSNRGHDSITVFAFDDKTGRLKFVQNEPTQGSAPRGFGIDPTGSYFFAANQRSHTVIVFRIDQRTGRLTPTGQTISLGSPVCVKFVKPAGR
jgi:6-phosphogluconolactonase